MLARLLPAAVLAATLVSATGSWAASFDGRWSVLLVTESGTCEMYRLNIQVANGRVSAGPQGPRITGAVTPRGVVRLNAIYGSDVASANGSVSGDFGRGRWSAPSQGCVGRWQAERRG